MAWSSPVFKNARHHSKQFLWSSSCNRHSEVGAVCTSHLACERAMYEEIRKSCPHSWAVPPPVWAAGRGSVLPTTCSTLLSAAECPQAFGFIWTFFFLDFTYLFIFREGKGGRKKGRGTSMCGCLLQDPQLGAWPTTQACALTGNQTGDPFVCRPALSPLSHTSSDTSQGHQNFSWPSNTETRSDGSVICLLYNSEN